MSPPLTWLLRQWSRGVGPRGRRVLHGSAWSLVAKACSAANLLLSLPLVKGVLDPTRFGIWATIVSLVAVGNFLDFGFGNGALNLVAGAQGRGAAQEIGHIARAARRPLLGVSLAFAAVGAVGVGTLPWADWFGAPAVSAHELRIGLAVVVATIAIGIPLNISTRILIGMGEAATAFRWQAIAQLATLFAITLGCARGAGLPVLIATAAATPLLAPLANTLRLRYALPEARDHRHPHLDYTTSIRREGALFFALQLAATLAFGLDLALVSRIQGADAAGAFVLPQRAFSVVSLALGLLWTPLWPTYRHALAAGDRPWVARTLRRSIVGAAAFAAVGAAGVAAALLVAPLFGRLGDLRADPRLIAGLAAWTVAESIGGALSTFFNAASIMRYQIIVATILAVTCIAAKSWAIGRWGAWASPWATLVVYAGVSLVPTAVFGRRLVHRALQSRHY